MRKAIHHLKAADPMLARVIEDCPPPKLGQMPPTFHTLARSIVFQQLSTKAAATIFGRLEAAAGGMVTPESILRVKPEAMRACGLSTQKLAYVRDLAERTRSGEVSFGNFERFSDAEVIEQLTRVKGVGTWTAHMFLIFALGRPDVLATGDLGVQTAVKRLYKLRSMPKPDRIEKIARAWRPYASYACWYLWRSLDLTRNQPQNPHSRAGAKKKARGA